MPKDHGPKLFFVAGETSGDHHGAALAREIRARRDDVRLTGMGGAAMAEAGVEILQPIDELQVMGFAEVLANYARIRAAFDHLLDCVREQQPDALILIDYPGFNLRFAAAVRAQGAADGPNGRGPNGRGPNGRGPNGHRPKILYYISPQVWAWRRSRLKTMRRLVDRMLVIFDFEAPLYEQAGIPVEFVGHPLLDSLEPAKRPDTGTGAADRAALRRSLGLPVEGRLIALLPGSRRQEVQQHLPVFHKAAAELNQRNGASSAGPLHFAVAAPDSGSGREDLLLETRHSDRQSAGQWAPVIAGRTYEVVRAADLAWVSSGTATLETALLGTPLVCCYRTGLISYFLAGLLVELPCISLVNIVAGRPIIPELVQHRLTPQSLARITHELLDNPDEQQQMRNAFATLAQRLGGPGASARAAQAVLREVMK